MENPQPKRKVLVVTYYWPPSGGSGVQRWLKFAKYLPSCGWLPVIYTPDDPSFDVQDDSLLEDIPDQIEVIKRPIWEPYGLGALLFGKSKGESNKGLVGSSKKSFGNYIKNWIRGNIFIPDPRKYWVSPSVSYLKSYLKKHSVDVIVTTGPPHSMHLIGYGLNKATGIPWIADFRDPWSELDMLQSFHPTKWAMRKYRALEQKVLKQASLVLTVSETWKESFTRLGAKRVEVITNGFDWEDFKQDEEPYDEFVISHFGLFNHLRNPKNFWEALHLFCKEDESFNKRLRIHLGGTVDPSNIEIIKNFDTLKDKVKIFDYLDHKDVIKEYKKSSLLLLLLFESEIGLGNIPGKIFEYLASGKKIIGFGSRNSDSEKIISQTLSGKFYGYHEDVSTIKEGIKTMYLEGAADVSINEKVNTYSRQVLTQNLSKLLGDV